MFNVGGGMNIPKGVPPALAISVLTSGYTEEEVRQIIVDGGDADKEEEWIQAFQNHGYFSSPGPSEEQALHALLSTANQRFGAEQDGARYLWSKLMSELRANESDFKHRITALDNEVKTGYSNQTLFALSRGVANDFVPFPHGCPWNGCKFVSSAVLHLVTKADIFHKREAVKPVSHSLGGCTIPPPNTLKRIRWPYVMSDAFKIAKEAATKAGKCTALHIWVTDVEIMEHPRPSGTFAHSCVMTCSPAGVYLFQGYGPQGYTLLQYMQEKDSSYPLSFDAGQTWVDRFEEFAADFGGVWTRRVNDAYAFCFGVDLAKLGCMRIGTQMDLFCQVFPFDFDTDMVRRNFELLPQRNDRTRIPCLDGNVAKAKHAPPGKEPNGGVRHYYIPVVLRCAHCGKNDGSNSRCVACKIVHYCSKECQKKDWKLRHKEACKRLISANH